MNDKKSLQQIGDGLFSQVMARVRKGDNAAIVELVNYLVPGMLAIVRRAMRKGDPLRAKWGSTEMVSECLATLVDRILAGDGEWAKERIIGLSFRLAKAKVITERRRFMSQKRGGDWHRDEVVDCADLPDRSCEEPGDLAAMKEFRSQVVCAFTPAEAKLVDLRLAGKSWNGVGIELGCTAECARKRWVRVVATVQAQWNERSARPD